MRKKLKITEDDLKLIHGDDYKFFLEKIIPNCYCHKCKDANCSTIINYEIYLNDIDDVLLSGYCQKCNSRVNRYIETGEVEKYSENINKIRRKHATKS